MATFEIKNYRIVRGPHGKYVLATIFEVGKPLGIFTPGKKIAICDSLAVQEYEAHLSKELPDDLRYIHNAEWVKYKLPYPMMNKLNNRIDESIDVFTIKTNEGEYVRGFDLESVAQRIIESRYL